jgi:hypothetical protein
MYNRHQEYLRLEKQASRQRPSSYDTPGGFWGKTRKPLWKLLQEALLSERDLQMIQTERLQYTQLLYRCVTTSLKRLRLSKAIAAFRATRPL